MGEIPEDIERILNMATNISEFERLKPTKTYQSIQKAILYLEHKQDHAISPIMDDVDAARAVELEIVMELLKEIEDNFLKGA